MATRIKTFSFDKATAPFSAHSTMITMDDAIFELYGQHIITEDLALHYAQDRAALAKRIL